MDPRTQARQIKSRLGVVPQIDNLDTELTVRENLEMYARYFDIPGEIFRKKAQELLEFVQLDERAKDQVEPLSGGMKRRLTIARALINDPDLVILDEPTTGLDPQARHLLWERLYQLKRRGATLIITTHYMDEAEQLCDHLVVMDKAKIVAEGSPRRADRPALDPRGPRAAPDRQRARGPERQARRARRTGRGAARPPAPLHRRRRAHARAGQPAPDPDRVGARAPLEPRGRLPAPDRPVADRIGR